MPSPQQEAALDRQLAQATNLISEGKYHQALPLYESILKARPHHIDALNNAAIVYLQLGHIETAASYFSKALDCDPSDESSFFNLIRLHTNRGDEIRAALTFHAFDQQIPDSPKKKNLAHKLWPPHVPGPLFDDEGTPHRSFVRRIHANWSTRERSTSPLFLYKTLKAAAQTSNAILGCGAGLATLVLARLAAQRNLDVWVLEHDPTWHAYFRILLERQGLEDAIHVRHTSLYDYGECVWYGVPSDLPKSLGLVVCGSLSAPLNEHRYGLYPILQGRFTPSCSILLDNVSSTEKPAVLQRWTDETSLDVDVHHAGDTSFAVLSRSSKPSTSPPAPSPKRRARPPRTDVLREYLHQKPHSEKVFYRLIHRLLDAGYDEEAADIFQSFEANIPESASKQSLRNTLFAPTIDLDADHPGPICIGGCGSSGTNLLRRILDMHSQIACGKEMSIFDRPRIYRLSLSELYDIYRSGSYATLEEEMPYRLATGEDQSYCGLQPGNHGDYYHTPAEVLDLFDRAESVADFLDKYFLSFAQKHGKRIWAEKTPNNIFCARDFLEMFPRGRFIHVIRDGRDVWLSLVKRRNYKPSSATVRWIITAEVGLRIADHPRVYTVRYEDLVLQPEKTLKALFEWLQLPYEERVLQFDRKNEKNRHGYAESSIHTESVFRWKKEWSELPTGGQQQLNLALSRHLIAMGYKSPTTGGEHATTNTREILPEISPSGH